MSVTDSVEKAMITRKPGGALLVFLPVLIVTIGAIALTFIGYLLFNSMIAAQQHRNQVLTEQIAQLDKQIEEINNLESAKQKFIARMDIIEKLQRSRPEIVLWLLLLLPRVGRPSVIR